MSQRFRRFLTIPAFAAACAFQIIVWIMWLQHRVGDPAFWRSEKTTGLIMVILVVVEWTMHDSGGGEPRGFDVLPKK